MGTSRSTPDFIEPAPLAIVLTGGGARGAYQVGVLRALGRYFPDLHPPIITGVSAGAINAVYLASHPGSFGEATEGLAQIWENLHIDEVVKGNISWLAGNALRWLTRLGTGVPNKAKALLDTAPLRQLLHGILDGSPAGIAGIEANLERGTLQALALTTVNYGTGQTVHWVEGRDIETWRAANRVSRLRRITLDHVMASSALPLIFPAVELEDGWYGDGGIRMAAPLSPALHLGAKRILAVSTRYQRSQEEADSPTSAGYPSPANIGGNLMNAIFLDVLEQDATRLDRMNQLLRKLPVADRDGMEPVDLALVRPSQDLGRLAGDLEPALPKGFRLFARRLGSKESKSPDFLSLLMFQPDYLHRLIEIGERDVVAQLDDIRTLFQEAEDHA